MELIERYVYAVTRQLPANQRAEVERELKSLIQDMLAHETGEEKPSRKAVEKTLAELGDPALLAEKYRGSQRYLIGPKYFETYFLLLRIVAAAVALGLTIAMVVGFVVNPPQGILEGLVSYVTAVLGGITQVFAGLTIVFALFEHFGVDISEISPEKKWSPSDLPMPPVKAARIKPAESIAGILFAVFFLILLNSATHLIGIYFNGSEGFRIIPLLDPVVFSGYLPYCNLLLVLAIGKESFKLLAGKWTLTLAGINFLHNAASLIIFITAFSNTGLWNSEFLNFILETGVVETAAELEGAVGLFTKGLMAVVAFALLLDTITSLVKAVQGKTASYSS